ncbi:MAG: hypothetical protein A2748_00570 [Candidatus Wildermuthbacteria bacterium RIFCSPHIGHO2_01_FULL_45_20]|uniref:Serine protease n=1 Tax=Candidatus Wildermuthbacteria bacterium RIFCSPHIGHO2_02_FULL_45_25 TaxID=1802450 RepID=A0A1G2R488_9BACT|nr:MAG: hypothetical protein A2748_00570 [Candidatus Wildermuthbacteria bacterium RIFCSPHIGHO2_01_FULL_45_20]OHA67674.1 MAG: hypothetical protein A3C04_02030 [Candidatus Wildermuthbacteria bacterium RIFCSPHIGHO2_02_FULL_45_25]
MVLALFIATLYVAQFEGYIAPFNAYAALRDLRARVEHLETQMQKSAENDKQAGSPEDQLPLAVERVVPSVVSVVITKDVPKLEIVYENPFGEDPFFRDFDLRIPRYRQRGTERQQVGAGTGFLITSDGYIATNRHVVEDTQADYTVLLSDGTQKQGAVMYRDSDLDFAVLKIDGENYPASELGNSSNLRLGQFVFAVGNALGEYSNSVSIGIVSGLNRNLEAMGNSGTEKLQNVIQTDAAINPGNSGGPLADLQGRVIGVNVATVRGSENISFAVPIDFVKDIIKQVAR